MASFLDQQFTFLQPKSTKLGNYWLWLWNSDLGFSFSPMIESSQFCEFSRKNGNDYRDSRYLWTNFAPEKWDRLLRCCYHTISTLCGHQLRSFPKGRIKLLILQRTFSTSCWPLWFGQKAQQGSWKKKKEKFCNSREGVCNFHPFAA